MFTGIIPKTSVDIQFLENIENTSFDDVYSRIMNCMYLKRLLIPL